MSQLDRLGEIGSAISQKVILLYNILKELIGFEREHQVRFILQEFHQVFLVFVLMKDSFSNR